ncbi:MAG: glycosyltransferase family 2 protein [Elusimicrobiota bacterium]
MIPSVDLSIVIPFYNEEENVEKVCGDLSNEFTKHSIHYEIVAVNNGSYDRTPELLKKLAGKYPQIKVVTVEINQGYGWGVIQGLKSATGKYVGYMAGDGQIKPEDVVRVFKKIKEEGLDFAQGKRITREDGFLRKINSKIFNILFQFFFPNPSIDIGSNPKIFTRSLYEKISPVSKDWFIDSEFIIKSSSLGAKMSEVPLSFQKREKGNSHIKLSASFQMLKNILRWKFYGGK